MTDRHGYRPAPGAIPDSPGVYRFRDQHGRVIYVGKAKSLRQRLNSYFADFAGLHPRTQAMLNTAAGVDWTVVGTEVEAFQLEYSWIKEFDPRFNIRYRDDKSYPYLAVTMSEEYPRVMVMRGAKRKGTRYFGPYSHAWAIRDTVDTLLRVFPVRTCSAGVFKRSGQIGRPCLLGYIGKCSAPCVGRVSADDHRALAEDFCDFMAGQTSRFASRLESEMKQASAAEEFERAARLRDDLRALERAIEKQAVVLGDGTDCDVIALVQDQLEAAVQVFYVRGGRVRGQRGWVLDKVEEVTTAGLVENFLGQVYGDSPADAEAVNAGIPREILVPELPPDPATMTQWLAGRRGGPVSLRVPQRGDKKALMDTVARNAGETLALHKTRRASDLTTRSKALNEIADGLGLDDAPLRIECYDVSNLQGTHVVASMVVFEDGLARKSEYRRFAIKGLDGTDDIAAIHEVILRRFRRYLAERERTGELDTLGDPEAGEPAGIERAGRRVGRAGGRVGRAEKICLSAQPGGGRRGPAAGRRGGPGPGRARHRRRGRVRAGQAPGGGMAAGRGVPGHPPAQQRGTVPAAAGPGRGAPVRHHLSPAEARQGGHRERARRRARARPGPARRAAQALRLGTQAPDREHRGDRRGARHRPEARGHHHRRAGTGFRGRSACGRVRTRPTS